MKKNLDKEYVYKKIKQLGLKGKSIAEVRDALLEDSIKRYDAAREGNNAEKGGVEFAKELIRIAKGLNVPRLRKELFSERVDRELSAKRLAKVMSDVILSMKRSNTDNSIYPELIKELIESKENVEKELDIISRMDKSEDTPVYNEFMNLLDKDDEIFIAKEPASFSLDVKSKYDPNDTEESWCETNREAAQKQIVEYAKEFGYSDKKIRILLEEYEILEMRNSAFRQKYNETKTKCTGSEVIVK